jgi:acyl carrier protein
MDLTMDDIEQRCIDIIAKSKSIAPETISLDSTFDSLAIDSLDKINISFEVEEAFNIEIPDEALGSLKTVGDIVNGVRKLVGQPSDSTTIQ